MNGWMTDGHMATLSLEQEFPLLHGLDTVDVRLPTDQVQLHSQQHGQQRDRVHGREGAREA